MTKNESEFEQDKDLIKERILEKIGNKKSGIIEFSTFNMGSLIESDNGTGKYFQYETYSSDEDLPKIIKAIEKENTNGKIKLKSSKYKKEKRKWEDPLGDIEEKVFNVYEIEFDLKDTKYGKEYIRKITFVSDDSDLKTPEKFNRFFINEDYKTLGKIREKSPLRNLIEYKLNDYKFTEQDYKDFRLSSSAIYMKNKYLISEIIERQNKRNHTLSNKIKIDLITQSKYNTLKK